MIKEHEETPAGTWLCLSVGKHVNVPTTRDGYKACGHCIRFVLDDAGQKQAWTMRDQLLLKRRLG
jgi:hypothetical protein